MAPSEGICRRLLYSVGLAPVLPLRGAALDVLASEPERHAAVRRNGSLFLKLAKEAGSIRAERRLFGRALIVGDSLRAVQLSNDLLAAASTWLPIIHPAVPEGQARLRFFITVHHTEEQIRRTVTLTANA